MKVYRVSMDGDFGDRSSKSIWFSRASDRGRYSRELKGQCHDGDSRPDPRFEQFDIPTDKVGLIGFLNVWCDE